jgi:PAS domain S-box-containing protein
MTRPVFTAKREIQALREEIAELKARLDESENMLRAIRSGEVDAIVVDTSDGERLFMLKGAEQPYREMVETMTEGAVTVSSDGAILYCNQRFAEMAKANLETIIGSNLLAYCSDENIEEISGAFVQSHDSVPRIRATLLAADATLVSVNMAMRSQSGHASDSIAIVITDLTKWQQAEQARERAMRALRMTNACAEVIIRSNDEAALVNGVCQALVALGGYKSAGVGFAGEAPAASFGPVGRSSRNNELRQGPGFVWVAPAIGSEPPDTGICNRCTLHPRDGQLRLGPGMPGCLVRDTDDQLIMTVPLLFGNEFIGCWIISSNEPGVFDQEELDLLALLADDLAFGVAALRDKAARARLAAIVDSAGEAIVGQNLDGLITSWNRAAELLFGYSADEIVGQPLAMLCPWELDGETSRLFATVQHGGTVAQFDSIRVAKDGRHIPVSLTFSPVLDAAGGIVSAAIFVRDNTARKHAEHALQASEARLRLVLDSLPQKIFLKDRDTNFVFCNVNLAKDFGIEPGDVVGKDLYGFFPQELAERYRAVDEEVMKSGQSVDLEERYVVDGIATVVQTIKVPTRDEHGEVIGLLGIFWDITERKQNEARLRESELLFHTLTDAMPQLVWMCTPDGLNIYFNQQWVDYTGLALEESYGQGWNTPFHPDDKQTAWDAWNNATRTGGTYRIESRLRAADGRYRWFLMKGEALADASGQIIKWLGTCTDIDELKTAQDELQQHRQHLEDSVAARTAELATSNQALANTNKELESFSYSVSHDLRAPLRAIDGFSAILLEEYGDKLDADGRRMLGVVREGSVKMAHLIDDILDFSRAGRTAMTLGVIDMNALVRSALADLAPVIKGRDLDLRIATLPAAYGDAHTIQRVWMNLLDNAIKYTAPRKSAVIEVGVCEIDGTTTYFVNDNGVGFDMQYVDKLFGLFQRLHSPEQFPGTGCGLAIVARIVTRNGGRLWAEGQPDRGATFYFVLPTTKEDHE